jgi:hypothetical protein
MIMNIRFKYGILIIFLLFFKQIIAQHFQIENKFNIENEYLTLDKFSNVYEKKGDVINRINLLNKKSNTFSNKSWGDFHHIDVTNPLRILLFYKNLSKVVFLDNTLSVHNDISLENYGLNMASLACTSNNNAFWIYDPVDFQLIRFDQTMKRMTESGSLIQIIGQEITPNFMVEKNDMLYLNDPNIGVLMFDNFGTYIKTIPIKNMDSFQVDGENIYFQKSTNSLVVFNNKLLTEKEIDFSEFNPVKIEVIAGKVFLLNTKNELCSMMEK